MNTPKKLKGGVEPHPLTTEERRKGAETTNRMKRERAKSARQRLGERLEQDFDVLYDAMSRAAQDGDVAAFKALFEHAFGKAPQAIELTGRDGEPLQVLNIPLDDLDEARRILEEARADEGPS